jgi:Fe-S cluster assembly scaffold protein SufB
MPTDTYTIETRGSAHSISDIGTSGSEFASFRALSEQDRQAITAIIESKYRIKLAQDQAKEDVKAVADKLGMKASELNRIVTLAMQERERGNVLVHERALIEVAEQVFLGFKG